ncbi:MAG: hypothetical protein KatS3mg104_0968 [Phycisphaerae bacterium]|nr:MAG: hypothetical protein KatS3mg104_0968 [Phycisphaerae bacterium]
MVARVTLFATILITWISISAGICPAAVLARWDFNSATPDSNIDTGSSAPSVGWGVLSAQGGVIVKFGNGEGSSDPAVAADDSSYLISNFPVQGTGNKSAGLRWEVSTAGYESIQVQWDQNTSAAAPNRTRFQYTLDATAATPVWIDGADFVVSYTSGNASWTNGRTVDLSGVAGLNDNPYAGFRVVAEFGTSTQYVASRTLSTYAPTGTWRIDMITVTGTTISVPEPNFGWIGVTLLGLMAKRYH